MKTLTLIRHAKSDWGHEGLMDIDRPLNQRGYEDAYAMCRWYIQNCKAPQLLVTSPATRNLSTAFIFARGLGLPMQHISINPAIYECSNKLLLQIITELDNAHDDILLFAHNPSITNVCNELTDDLFFENIPTCGLVRIAFDTADWKTVSQIRGKTVVHHFPKNFRST